MNLASRIQTAAPQGQHLITADSARHGADLFDLAPFGALDLKGIGRLLTQASFGTETEGPLSPSPHAFPIATSRDSAATAASDPTA
jgi:hypothetical protein